MSNSFYNHGAFPSTGSAATSASMRAELDLVSAGFDKMPTLAGNANKFVIVNSTGTGLTQTDVLPAFSVNDTDFTVQDDGDNTRKFQFNAGSITTGNTRIYSMPDLDTTLVGTNVTQTLTNKTLTAPVIATIVNTGTLTLPTSTDTLVGRNTTDTLTNKTLTNPVIGTIINTGTLTLPTSTDTLVGRATTDTLSNKSISGASNTLANIGNSSLTNSSVVIGSTTLSLGGTMTTLAGVTISGASNTLTNIANASLTNSGVTFNGVSVALGASGTITASTTNALTVSTGLQLDTGTTFNGGAARTISIDSTVATLSGAQTLSNKTISGSSNTISNIANASLTNSTITIGSSSISLGSTATTISGLTSLSSTGLVMTASAASSTAISAIAQSAGTVTVTAAGHGLSSSDLVSIDGVADYTYTGLVTVNVTNANVFTYSRTTTNASSSGGYVTKLQGTWASYSGGTGPSYKGGPMVIEANSQMPGLRVTQSGNGYAFIVEDAANPDTSAFIISNAGDLAINTNKFTVAAASGNTLVAGTLDATGNFNVNTNKFSVVAASGNTTIAGTTSFGGNIVSNLLFTDATYDIGASGATRPRDLFLSRNLVVGGTLTLAGGVNLNGNVTVGDSSADTLTINATITSNLLFTDNTYDIGASGATRPRNLFLAGNATIGGNTTMTGSLTVDSTTDSSSTTTGSIQTDGGLGVAKAAYIGTVLSVGGKVTLQADTPFYTGANLSSGANALGIGGTAGNSLIGFFVNNSEQARLTSTGLGIGTTPSNRLHVVYGGSAVGAQFTASAGYAQMQLTAAGSNQSAYYTFNVNGTGKGIVQVNAVDVITADTSGLVGIAQTPNLTQLEVRQTTTYAFGINNSGSSQNYSMRIDSGAANALVIGTRTTSTDLLWLTTGGRFGIGVSSPGYALDVGDTAGGNMFRFTRSGVELSSFISGGTPFFGTTSNTTLALMTNGTERARITNVGDVLIGATSTNGRLTIVGSNASSIPLGFDTNASYAQIQSYASSPLYVQPLGNNIVFNSGGGNAGFGTTSVAYKVHINESSTAALGVFRGLDVGVVGAAGQNIEIGALNGTTPTVGASITGVLNNPSTSGFLTFNTRTSGTVTEKARVTADGDLLVGTTSSSGKLTVVNSAGAQAALFSCGSGTTQQAVATFSNSTNGGYLSIAGVGTSSAVGTWTNGSMVVEGVPFSSGNTFLGSYTGALVFQNGRNNSGRFTSDGTFLVGTDTTPVSGYNCFAENGADVQIILQRTSTSAGYGGIGGSAANALNVYSQTGGLTKVFEVTQGGATYNTTGTYGTISDIKIKENIQDSRGYLEDLCKVRIVKYSLKADAKSAPDKLGVIAQELEQIFPNMIEEQPDVVNGKEVLDTTTKTVKYSVFVPMLIKAMQEQQVMIDQLKAEVAALKGA